MANFPLKWFKNDDGKSDSVLTMAWIGFVVVIFRVLVSGLEINIFNQTLKFSPMDSNLAATVLTPTLGAYVVHMYNSYKNNPFYLKARLDINNDGKPEEVSVDRCPNADCPLGLNKPPAS